MYSIFKLATTVAFLLSMGHAAFAQDVLLLDYGSINHVAKTALNDQGLAHTETTDSVGFEAALTSGSDWDLVVVDSPCHPIDESGLNALADYIDTGGRVVLSYWNLDETPTSLLDALGVAGSSSLALPARIYDLGAGSSLWTTPNTISPWIDPGADLWIDNGDLLTAGPAAWAIGGYAPTDVAGEAAVIVANAGRTITIGHELDSLDTGPATDFVENAIAFVMQDKKVLLLEDLNFSVQTTARDALLAESLIHDRVGVDNFPDAMSIAMPWDLVVVECAYNELPDPAKQMLADYVNNGGKSLMSYWDLDEAPLLAEAFGVTVDSSFTTPETIYDWIAGSPYDGLWTTPNTVPSTIDADATSPFFDNGDKFMADLAGGVAPIAGFTDPPLLGNSAVVAANDDRTIVIGHEFTSLDSVAITDFVQNCIHFLCFYAPPPANDLCVDATTVSHGDTVVGTLVGATNDGSASCGFSSANGDVWYSFENPLAVAVSLVVDTCGTHDFGGTDDGVNTVLSILSECGGVELDCNNNWPAGAPVDHCAGLDEGNTRDSVCQTNVAAGATVTIRVSHAGSSDVGPFVLHVNATALGVPFRRADANGDGMGDVADAVFLLNALFVTGSPISECADAADVNDDGMVDIADPTYFLGSLFVSGSPPPPAPFAGCGIDPTADGLDCAFYPCP